MLCAHLSAYGRDNERRGWPGYDYLMQAEAGYLHLSGEPGSPPARMGLSIVDYMTGITTSAAILASLIGVLKSGQGHDIDVSLFDVALHQLTYPGAWYLNAGYETRATAAQRAPDRGAGATAAHGGRLDLRHVHDTEILGGTGAAARSRRPRQTTRALQRAKRDTNTVIN